MDLEDLDIFLTFFLPSEKGGTNSLFNFAVRRYSMTKQRFTSWHESHSLSRSDGKTDEGQ